MSTPLPPDDEEETGRWVQFLFLASVAFHVAIFYTLHEMPEPEAPPKLILYEVAIENPPEPEEAEPEPEPEPELEEPEPEPEPELETPPPEIEPPKPPPKQLKKEPPPKQPPPSSELPPPPKIRLPDSQLVPSGSGSPVSVNPGGTTTSPGRTQGSDTGKPGGRGKPTSTGTGTGGPGTAPTGPTWAPKSDIYIKTVPTPKRQPPKVQCPASRDKGIYGTVVLSLDVQRDGTIRKVKVVRGIGSGCNEVAVKAVKKMLLSPAVGTDGKIADYAGLRYEYVFDPPS